MKVRRETATGASAVSPHDPMCFAQAVEWPNGAGCWLQVRDREPLALALAWGEARAVVEVLQALLEEDDE